MRQHIQTPQRSVSTRQRSSSLASTPRRRHQRPSPSISRSITHSTSVPSFTKSTTSIKNVVTPTHRKQHTQQPQQYQHQRLVSSTNQSQHFNHASHINSSQFQILQQPYRSFHHTYSQPQQQFHQISNTHTLSRKSSHDLSTTFMTSAPLHTHSRRFATNNNSPNPNSDNVFSHTNEQPQQQQPQQTQPHQHSPLPPNTSPQPTIAPPSLSLDSTNSRHGASSACPNKSSSSANSIPPTSAVSATVSSKAPFSFASSASTLHAAPTPTSSSPLPTASLPLPTTNDSLSPGTTRPPVASGLCDLISVSQSSTSHRPPPASLLAHSTSTNDTYQPNPSFYRRHLNPESCIHFNSPRGRKMFSEALAADSMEPFFPLIEQFTTQLEPAFCGLSSLAMVMNAMSIDPVSRNWKRPWRWFSDDHLACCHSLSSIEQKGLTFEQFCNLGRCHGLTVDEFYAQDVTIELLRNVMIYYSSFQSTVPDGFASEPCFGVNPNRFEQYGTEPTLDGSKPGGLRFALCVSFNRATLHQTGDGHVSPIAGYHAASDSVLILDVARFKYPPYWVTLTDLFHSMQDVDVLSGRSRGFCVLSPSSSSSFGGDTSNSTTTATSSSSSSSSSTVNHNQSRPSSFFTTVSSANKTTTMHNIAPKQ